MKKKILSFLVVFFIYCAVFVTTDKSIVELVVMAAVLALFYLATVGFFRKFIGNTVKRIFDKEPKERA
jgi:hypothetical protein